MLKYNFESNSQRKIVATKSKGRFSVVNWMLKISKSTALHCLHQIQRYSPASVRLFLSINPTQISIHQDVIENQP